MLAHGSSRGKVFRAKEPQRGDRSLEKVEYDRRDNLAVPMFRPAGAEDYVGRKMIPRRAPWASMFRP